eukprot:COSAG02_NODE_8393_length_2587_cov_1.414791_3_plen_428_part_00
MLRRRSTETMFEEIVQSAGHAPCDEKSLSLLPVEGEVVDADVSALPETWATICIDNLDAWPSVCGEFVEDGLAEPDLEAMIDLGCCSPPAEEPWEPRKMIQKPRKSIAKKQHQWRSKGIAAPSPNSRSRFKAADVAIETGLAMAYVSPAAKGRKLFGPAPGVRHKTFGCPPADENGHLRLVTHPVGKNVQFNKGVGVEVFEVDGITEAPGEGVIERLEIEVHQVNGAKPREKPGVEVHQGERFLPATIRDKALSIMTKNPDECPSQGLNWWRISGNRFHFIYGEASKTTRGRMNKGVVRCASWQLRYSQVMIYDGQETEIFAYTVPDTFIIRSACVEVDERNAESKRIMNSRKQKAFALLKAHGYKGPFRLKCPYSQLVSLMLDLGLTPDQEAPPPAAASAPNDAVVPAGKSLPKPAQAQAPSTEEI